jgi:hypothetical protein
MGGGPLGGKYPKNKDFYKRLMDGYKNCKDTARGKKGKQNLKPVASTIKKTRLCPISGNRPFSDRDRNWNRLEYRPNLGVYCQKNLP